MSMFRIYQPLNNPVVCECHESNCNSCGIATTQLVQPACHHKSRLDTQQYLLLLSKGSSSNYLF